MKKTRSKVAHLKNKALYQKLENLELHWASLCKLNKLPTADKCLAHLCSDSILNVRDKLLCNSPQALMSSLQQQRIKPPVSNESWGVGDKDLAVQEIVRDRRAAIASGRLKGRRLFREFEGAATAKTNIDSLDLPQEIESKLLLPNSCAHHEELKGHSPWTDRTDNHTTPSSMDFAFSSEKLGRRGDQQVLDQEENKQPEKRITSKGLKPGVSGRKLVFAMAFLGLVSMLIALGLISMCYNGEYIHQEKVMLMPT